MTNNSSFEFFRAITRCPAASIVDGLRAEDTGTPDLKQMLACLAPYIRPLIFGFSNKVSGTGGRMFNAW